MPRLRFALLTATVLFVLSLNHQAVATLRVIPAGKGTQVSAGPRAAVVKQRVTLEATSPLVFLLAPAADAWLPSPTPPTTISWLRARLAEPQPRPSAVPDLFRSRLLVAALSPHAP
ncbi:hypothetical protein HMJ29_03265 [Hymenobacter taeanensis]|uniref:Uncharacterized protein n=1 Tax=Hymenobacter taeanensis TaxID=2735321 RepID=A0A6M6BCR5_9BACT|nr:MULTISPECIES: hypothetical protein [Hymenobacter]QJX46007.1 hypothetical protein HMJ29_03265 [Hymenobacter taeanensis]UOQ79859.1 hypothetical protein MUN83_13510 [Hymenobacter sp. 5414T-23]